jgi:benzil reductase ((S)-benzoin forming)
MDVVWISGASSGIGAALAKTVPDAETRIIGISRWAPARGEHVQADLAQPAAWSRIAAHFEEVLGAGDITTAVFLHMAGVAEPLGPVVDADAEAYAAAVVVNAASGQVLGQSFLTACRRAGARPTLVQCSSPAATEPIYGLSHYGAGKSALAYWAAAVAREVDGWGRVFSVTPYAVDTPMVRTTIATGSENTPIAGKLRDAAERGELATAETTAGQIWDLVLDGVTHGSNIPIGALPVELRNV